MKNVMVKLADDAYWGKPERLLRKEFLEVYKRLEARYSANSLCLKDFTPVPTFLSDHGITG